MNSQNLGRGLLLQRAARWLRSRSDRLIRDDGLLQSPQAWDAQYAAGRWDYLAELSELARFSVLAGYICHLKPGGAVLEAGCGQGILLRRLPRSAYSKYVGIDVASNAIAVAQRQQYEHGIFLVADCEHYSPAEEFDVIVFNEVLCCLRDPLHTVERYRHSLRPGGLMLMSNCNAARGSGTILKQLRRSYAILDEVCILHRGRNVSWTCLALRPRDHSPEPS